MIRPHLLEAIIQKFVDLCFTAFEFVFGDVDFGVLWRWLPGDIGVAALGLIALLFGLSLISLIRRFLPF